MSTATLTPTTTKPPRYPWRTVRHDGTINHYGNEMNRAKGARKHADTDNKPVSVERWTEDKGWHRDLLPGPHAELIGGPDDMRVFHLPEIGLVNEDGTVSAACEAIVGLRRERRCGVVPVVGDTAHCGTHQHLYRQANGIAEPERPPVTPVVVEDVTDGVPVLAEPADLSQLAAADGAVTVKVVCEPNMINEGSGVFASYLGRLAFGRETTGILYWSGDHSNVYTVQLRPIGEHDDAHETLRQARRITDGRRRHRAVKRAKDQIKARRTAATVLVDLEISNQYELHGHVTSFGWRIEVPAPPADRDSEEFDQWAYWQLSQRTGVGRVGGDSWYRGDVTWSSDATLIGHTFG
jgi:hypothetical protein